MLKVLVVEDSKSNRILMGQLVASLGYTPVLASDGARGLQVWEDNPDIAAVVSDCQMPNLDGPSLTREIRSRGHADLPILLYSSYLGVKDVGGLLDLGATGFLNYPVTRESLGEYLKRHIGHG